MFKGNRSVLMKYRTKLLVAVMVVGIGCLSAMAYLSINFQKTASATEIERQADIVGEFLNHFLLPALEQTPESEFTDRISELVSSVPVNYLHIYDRDNALVAGSGTHEPLHQHAERVDLSLHQRIYDQVILLPPNPLNLGEVHYGISIDHLSSQFYRSRIQLYSFIAVAILLMTIGAYFALRVFAKELGVLRYASRQISEGDFSHRISEEECGELVQTAHAFNLMCERLEAFEQEKQQEHLRLKELSLAVEKSPVSVLMTDSKGVITYANPSFFATTGYTQEDLIGNTPRMLKSGENSRDEYIDLWKTIKSGQIWRGELVNRRKDGSLFWDKTMIAPVHSEDGGVTHYIAVKEDVTEFKQIEKRMRAAQTVFDAASEAIMVTDLTGTIKMVNPAFYEITGFQESEIVGKNPKVLHSGHHDEAFYQDMFEKLQLDNRWEGEIWNRRKSGEVYPQWQTIAMVRDEEGEPLEYIALFSDISKRKELEDEMRFRANYDALTQLANRNLFYEQLEQLLKQAKRQQHSLALLYLDLDGFKQTNDTYGHFIGDCVLKQVAELLRETMRESDLIARLGGDEFVICLSPAIDEAAVQRVADKIIEIISRPMTIESQRIQIGTSIGISQYPTDSESVDELIDFADSAMYQAKRAGKNRHCFYSVLVTADNDEKAEEERG